MNYLHRYSIRRLHHQANVEHKFKDAMSRVASQAMILTAGFKNEPPHKHVTKSLHGMTLSSVCSLSVFPKPLLQFNLQLPSYTSKTLHENDGMVAIHILPSTPEAGKLGRIFASGIKSTKTVDGEIFHEMATPFKKIDRNSWEFIQFQGYTVPILKHSERIFLCNKKTVLEIDKHEIWVTNVLDVIEKNIGKTGGLIYFDRAFHKVGDSVEK